MVFAVRLSVCYNKVTFDTGLDIGSVSLTSVTDGTRTRMNQIDSGFVEYYTYGYNNNTATDAMCILAAF